MCGIAGIVNFNKLEDIPGMLASMSDKLRHRGPDGEGFFIADTNSNCFPAYGNGTPTSIKESARAYAPHKSIEEFRSANVKLGLAHRRLSIVDISDAGHQPMCDQEGRYWIIHNGEVYNYVELREELRNKGCVFQTGTDTEVILAAYKIWGNECVNRFEGMWSFVIYDHQRNILFCSRDRVGVKPFYFYRDKQVFAFASEQKALVGLPFVKTGINRKAAASFLAGDIQFLERGEENMFSNIMELLPGRNLIIDLHNASFKEEVYRVLPQTFAERSNFNNTNELFAETERRILNSVRLHLRSDVPIGSCLSGGIDSSAIVGAVDHLIGRGEKVNLGGQLKLFTLSFRGTAIDETHWAEMVAKKVNAEWHCVTPSADELMADLDDLNYAQDIPVCSTGTYGQFRLMRQAAATGVKVILDGQGGDELFGGYPSHAVVYWKYLLRRLKLGTIASEWNAGHGMGTALKWLIKDQARLLFELALPQFVQTGIMENYVRQTQFLNRDVLNEYLSSGASTDEIRLTTMPTLNDALIHDFYADRLKMYLKYEDRSSMWHSIEARTPFADDNNLASYVFGVPAKYKIRNGVYKYLLRESMKDYLPAAIRQRKDKLGFVTPIDNWSAQLKSRFLDQLDLSVKDFLDVDRIRKNSSELFDIRSHADGVRVFRMFSFMIWKKRFGL